MRTQKKHTYRLPHFLSRSALYTLQMMSTLIRIELTPPNSWRVGSHSLIHQYAILAVLGANIIGSEGDEWKKYRRIVAPAFSEVCSGPELSLCLTRLIATARGV
jgi:hypothetical protein